ncbi:hypothetical protein PR048_027701 [Dryococelus australis]|uniref:Uncharacterized protein n=1 Tax=Dryococelus australis TaxID=614101 RepID=A0ABQ9GH89_9NEOP|nr:hypothetical protein PR048_027701 [Dryococelus australis]
MEYTALSTCATMSGAGSVSPPPPPPPPPPAILAAALPARRLQAPELKEKVAGRGPGGNEGRDEDAARRSCSGGKEVTWLRERHPPLTAFCNTTQTRQVLRGDELASSSQLTQSNPPFVFRNNLGVLPRPPSDATTSSSTASAFPEIHRCKGAAVVLLASRLGEPGSIDDGVADWIFACGNRVPEGPASRRIFSGISRFPRPCIPWSTGRAASTRQATTGTQDRRLELWRGKRILQCLPASGVRVNNGAQRRVHPEHCRPVLMTPVIQQCCSNTVMPASIHLFVTQPAASMRKKHTPKKWRYLSTSIRNTLLQESRGGVVANKGSFPGGTAPAFSHVGIVPDDAAGPRVFSGISCFPRLFIPELLYTHLNHPPKSRFTDSLTVALAPAPECKDGEEREIPESRPAGQRHRPARFPRAKTRERPLQELNPARLDKKSQVQRTKQLCSATAGRVNWPRSALGRHDVNIADIRSREVACVRRGIFSPSAMSGAVGIIARQPGRQSCSVSTRHMDVNNSRPWGQRQRVLNIRLARRRPILPIAVELKLRGRISFTNLPEIFTSEGGRAGGILADKAEMVFPWTKFVLEKEDILTSFDSRRRYSHVGMLPIDAAGRRVFLRDLPFPLPLHSGAAPYSPQSPTSALKTSMLRAVQISSLTHFVVRFNEGPSSSFVYI